MTGIIKAIALRPARMAALIEVDAAVIEPATGLEGDHAGRDPDRAVTVLSAEAWAEALSLLPPGGASESLPWTTRRANLLVEGVRLPRAKGGVFSVGPVVLEITGQTYPCRRMEDARAGLLKALAKEWRGGVTCKVIKPGEVRIGDPVTVLVAPEEKIRKLP